MNYASQISVDANEVRELTAAEVDNAAGALHVHIGDLFHLAIYSSEISIGTCGVGVGIDSNGAFTFQF